MRLEKDRLPLSDNLNINPKGKEWLKNIMNILSQENEPLRIFCKEEGFYYFRNLSLYDHNEIMEKLNNDTLSKEDFFNAYKKSTDEEFINRVLLLLYCDKIAAFQKRKEQLKSATEAHFSEKYDLSIISFFVLIEGILRDVGELKPKDKIKPTLPIEGHEEDGRYFHKDGLGYFSAFITKLFEGSPEISDFNRNSILHGFNIDSFNYNNSLILLLVIVEIGDYIFNSENYINSISGKIDFAPYMRKFI